MTPFLNVRNWFFMTLAVVLSLGKVQAAGPQISGNAPVKNFSLPTFNDQGYRTMLARGGEAVLVNSAQANLKDMTLTVFSGDELAKVETVLISPQATVLIDKRVVTGDDFVRLIRDDLELTGRQWRYEHDEKRIFIGKDARVVFRAQLNDLIK